MGLAQREAELVLDSKLKYWEKVLSDEAIDSNLWDLFSFFGGASFWGDWVLSDTLFSSLISALFFDIPLSDVVPWTLAWRVELPTADEFLRGILIKLEPIDILTQFPQLATVSDLINSILTPEAAEAVEGTRLRKGVYGVTAYAESYYDPPAVREFLRSTMYAFTKKDVSWPEARVRIEKYAETLNVDPVIAESVFNRLSMITAVKELAATWDYAWWDETQWAPEGSGGVLTFTSWSLAPETVEYEQLWDAQAGGHWDLALWDYAFWTDDVSPYALDPERLLPVFGEMRDFIVSN